MSATRDIDRLLAADRAVAARLEDGELRALTQASETLARTLGVARRGGRRRSPVTGEPLPDEATIAAARRRNLQRAFKARREALADTMTVAEVAELLGAGRQAIHDRIRARSLLAVKDQGRLRLPAWQFDPEGPNGTVPGLPEVLRVLDGRPLSELGRALWFTSPKRSLHDRTPAAALADGALDDVLAEARTIGA
jgi:excisionase family DNA binding protein